MASSLSKNCLGDLLGSFAEESPNHEDKEVGDTPKDLWPLDSRLKFLAPCMCIIPGKCKKKRNQTGDGEHPGLDWNKEGRSRNEQ